VAPWWINVSSLKDDVDGAALDEHCQSFFVTENSSLAYVLSLIGVLALCLLTSTGWLHTCQGHTSMLPHSGNVGCAALMQSLSVALAAIAASPFLNVIVLSPN